MTSRSGVWGWGRERLWRGPGECGKEPCLTHQGLDSPRLPVSHPQTRPNQPTGPQAHAASHTGTHQHTDMHQHTGTNTHRHLPRHTQAEPQSDTGTQGRTPRDTADTRVTPTRKPTSVMTRAHIHTHTHTHTHTHRVSSQSPALLPSKLTLTGTDTHIRRHAHLTYSTLIRSCLPTPSHICQSWPREPCPRKGAQRRNHTPGGPPPSPLSPHLQQTCHYPPVPKIVREWQMESPSQTYCPFLSPRQGLPPPPILPLSVALLPPLPRPPSGSALDPALAHLF